jgi:hypothetical protein
MRSMTLLKQRLLSVFALAGLAFGSAQFASADYVYLSFNGTTPGGSVTLNPGQSTTITEYYVNTGANSTAINSDSGTPNTDIQIASFSTGVIWDTPANGTTNLKSSAVGLSTSNPLDDNSNTWQSIFAGPTIVTTPAGQVHFVASSGGYYDVLKNQVVAMFQFTLTAQAAAAPGTYDVNLVNPLGPTPTALGDYNGKNVVLNPAVPTTNTFSPAQDVQVIIPAIGVPEPASIIAISTAFGCLFLGRRKLKTLVA